MWFVIAMAVAAAQGEALRTENVRLRRENEALQLRIMEIQLRQGGTARTADMGPKRLTDEYETVVKRLDRGDQPDRLEPIFVLRLREVSPINQNARLKAEQGQLRAELMGLLFGSRRYPIRGI